MLPVLPGPPQRQRGLMGRKQGADEKVLSFKARLNEEGVGGGEVIRLQGATSCDRGSFLPSGPLRPMAVLMEGAPIGSTNLHARQSW